MKLIDVLKDINCTGIKDAAAEISDIAYDSRKAGENIMFVCLKGAFADGHKFAKSAYEKGSRVFLCEKEIDLPPDAQIIICEDTRAMLAKASCNFFENPSKIFQIPYLS